MCENERNESVNYEFKIMKQRSSLHQIMTANNEADSRLIIFLIHYFDVMNPLKSDKVYYILIQ